jgi:hypothetical protein
MKKIKGLDIYNSADDYIKEMVKFDMIGVIAKYNKRFDNLFYKSLPEIFRVSIEPEMIKDLIVCCDNRIRQSKIMYNYKDDYYDESLVQKYYIDFKEKLKNWPLTK